MNTHQLIKALKAMEKAAKVGGVDPQVKFNTGTGTSPIRAVRFEQEPSEKGPAPVIMLYNWVA